MSQIKQVSSNLWLGPKEMGITPQFKRTDHAIAHYPNGTSLIHDPVQPGNKKRTPDYEGDPETEHMGEVFEGSSAGGHEGYLDMRVDSVTNRSEGFYIMGIIGMLFWWSFHYFVLTAIENEQVRNLSIYSGYAFFGLGALICLFRTLHTPVRFHKANQEVYVWHKKVLYRIPWQECELSIRIDKRTIGLKGQQDGYQLTLWLNPKHAVNKDLSGQQHVPLNMFHNMDHHIPLYAYWEYVRRYMTGDTPLYIEMSTKSRTPRFNTKKAKSMGYGLAIPLLILIIPLAFVFKPNKVALLSPFKEKWPEEVHEWTGERCDWH